MKTNEIEQNEEKNRVEQFLLITDKKIMEAYRNNDQEGIELYFVIREKIIERLSQISKNERIQRTWKDYRS